MELIEIFVGLEIPKDVGIRAISIVFFSYIRSQLHSGDQGNYIK